MRERLAGSGWRDLGAGLCVAGLLIPEAVAYAGLAKLPPSHGLTAALVGLAIYAVFGRSRYAIVSPTSSTAALAAAAALSMPGIVGVADPRAYAQAMQALVLCAGAILFALSWARQGQLSAFVSRPVLRGFSFGLAITIVIKQLPDALGIELPKTLAGDPGHVLAYVVAQAPHWQLPTVAVTLAAAALMALIRRWPQWPASMLVMVAAIAAARGFDLQALGVRAVGTLPLPSLAIALPQLSLADWFRVGELAVGVVVLVFAESWGCMRTLALQHGETLDANRELWVLGACNVGAGLLQGMPVGAGFSGGSANAAAGAQTRWAGAAALLVMALALAFALPELALLPRPVLAVAVISALWHALSPRPLLATWRMGRDRTLIVAAVAAVLVLGVLDGMLTAIALSLVDALRKFSQPLLHELGELGATRNYVDVEGHTDVHAKPGLLVLRPEEPLFFASAERVVAEVVQRAAARDGLRGVVLSLEESADLDSTAVECLLELDQRLQARGQHLVLARTKDPVRELLGRLAPQGIGAPDRLYWSVDDAVQGVSRRDSI
ncbi:MAG: SulP family inorganic anion transporter [Burkholderiales bacterium]|nr:STAS domain-containing protein [Burkholderiales bacterium]MDE1926984.1 SulP family inorganic anion transporter [Burkholderiales bacterium]MDE2158578.1 SulP family inorganic anion transporter [Burkholderiales bacterium]